MPKFFELTVEDCPPSTCNGTAQQLSIAPTAMRTDETYIRVYILWLSLIVQIVVPFFLLGVLNAKIYGRIKRFELAMLESTASSASAAASVRLCYRNRRLVRADETAVSR